MEKKDENIKSALKETVGNIKNKSQIDISDVENLFEAHEVNKIKREFQSRFAVFILVSLGVITALAWDTFLKGIFEFMIKDENPLLAKLLYALLLTLITAVVSVYFSRKIKKSSNS